MPLLPFIVVPLVAFFLGVDWSVAVSGVMCLIFWGASSRYWDDGLLPIDGAFTSSAMFMWLITLVNLMHFFSFFIGIVIFIGLILLGTTLLYISTNIILIQLMNVSPKVSAASFLNSLLVYFVLTILSFIF